MLEADPALTFVHGDDTVDGSVLSSVLLSPGVGFALDPEQPHIFELAVLFSVPTTSGASFDYATSVTYVA